MIVTLDLTHANNHLPHYNGSDTFTKLRLGVIATEGALALAQMYKCHWLLEAICSHQIYPKVAAHPFQVWELKKEPDSSARLLCEDGNKNKVTSQIIPMTDFPLSSATLWVVGGTLMLPSEY